MTNIPDLTHYIINHETERLTLKTLEDQHYSERYLSWLSDPEVIQYLELRHAKHTKETTLQFIQNMLNSPNNLQMGIFLKDGDRHIGNIKIGPVNKTYARADIGLMIGDKDSWGKGYATEAIKGVTDIAFNTLNLQRVQAGAYASNKGSIKAFLKAGYEQEGVLKNHFVLDGKPEDDILVAKLAQA